MNIPTVFIHLNESDYVLDTVAHAAVRNQVHVISNIDYSKYLKNINASNISYFQSDSLNIFSNNYKHLHSGPHVHEMFCYQRWFFLLDFMRTNSFEKILHLDSDVILNVDASKDIKEYDQYIMTLCHGSSGATSYVTYEGLKLFTEMLLDIYCNNSYCIDLLECQYNNMQRHNKPGGVCDMTLLNMFREKCDYGGGPNRVGEMMTVINDATHDHNINVNDSDYSMHNNIKNFHIIDNKIYVFNERLNKDIEFKSLHCQGAAKKYIKEICGKLSK